MLADIAHRIGHDVPGADYRALPRVTFTDPEVGGVGMTRRRRMMPASRPRRLGRLARVWGWIHGPGNAGLIKLVEDADRGVLVGATSVGPWGGEVLSVLTLAVHAEVPVATLRTMHYAFPTFHRAVQTALADLQGRGMDAAGRVRAAMAAQPRERFLPAAVRRRASYDGPLDIGHGQTNSQPRTVRDMLQLLDVQPGHRVLDVGSGSGWSTALLAELVGPTGSVLGLERVPDLVVTGRANVEAAGMPWARVRAAVPGVLGAPQEAPFDRVLVSAMADVLPLELVAQLGAHGILVAPVAGRMLRVVRDERPPTGVGSPSTATTASCRSSPDRPEPRGTSPGSAGVVGVEVVLVLVGDHLAFDLQARGELARFD